MSEASRRNRREKSAETPTTGFTMKPAVWKALIALGVVIVLGLGTVVAVQFAQLQELRNPNLSEQQRAQNAEQLVAEVGEIMLLPDEEATIATVEDAAALTGQAFFANAEDGDKVVIFPETELAVIYRPGDRLIVNAGPLVLNAKELAEGDVAEETPAEEAPAE